MPQVVNAPPLEDLLLRAAAAKDVDDLSNTTLLASDDDVRIFGSPRQVAQKVQSGFAQMDCLGARWSTRIRGNGICALQELQRSMLRTH